MRLKIRLTVIASILGSIILSGQVFSSAVGATMPLGIFYLEPNQKIQLPLDKLFDGISYRVLCDVKYKYPFTEANNSHLAIKCPARIKKNNNNDTLCYFSQISSFDPKGSKFEFDQVYKDTELTLRNLDFTEIVSVNCTAMI